MIFTLKNKVESESLNCPSTDPATGVPISRGVTSMPMIVRHSLKRKRGSEDEANILRNAGVYDSINDGVSQNF